VPVLARTFEAAGMSTITVTNMPFWAEKVGVPRTLAVEFPFGHILGQPHNVELQMRVIGQALDVLETAEAPGTIIHSQEKWPAPLEEALHDSHPETPPPIAADLGRYIGQFLRGLRRGKK
jgi:D-proline reductase (dithiol) PrdB